MEIYNKTALTFQQQIDLLQSIGLVIGDIPRTLRHLSNISYFRLSAYMLPFKEYDANGSIQDQYVSGTTWDHVINLYRFDRKLRLILFDSIERIEVAVRTQIIYQLSHKYGSHWHENPALFPPKTLIDKSGKQITINTYEDIKNHIYNQLNINNKEIFIEHYKTKYSFPETPPSWMSVEVMYFSQLSNICSNLGNRQDRVGIASYFGLPENIFCSWLHAINYVRNLCAHHSRVWNRDLNIVPAKLAYSKHLPWISNPDTVKRGKIYFTFCIINYLLQTANPNNTLKNKIISLFQEFSDVKIEQMGFPKEWNKETIWR